MARVARWILLSIGAPILVAGFFYLFESFRLGLTHKPTGASLTLGFSLMVLSAGLGISLAGYFVGKKE